MAEYVAEVTWTRGAQPFTDNRYKRVFETRFPGGAILPGSASPHVVPAALTDPGGVDPEQMFVSSLSSCHMLWFLSIAAKHGWLIDRYDDRAVGQMAHNAQGQMAMSRVTLHPCCSFTGGTRPDRAALVAAHEQAHAACFIANSVRTEVVIDLGAHA